MKLEFPLLVYVDDNYRWSFFGDPNSVLNLRAKQLLKQKKYSFDERDYLVEVNDDKLGPEDMLKLKNMLDEVDAKEMSAQDIVDSVGGRR